MPVLHEAQLFRVRLPLVSPFRTAHGVTTVKEALLVRVQTDAGIGWGECVAAAEPTYSPDTIDGARLALRDHLLPRVFAGAGFDDVRGHETARAALECALLDAQLRADGVSLAVHLGARQESVDAGVAIGLAGTDAEARDAAAAYAAAGYRRIKCKIEPGRDSELLRAVRAEIGDVALAADANASYDFDAAHALLRDVDDLTLQCIEQPLAADAWHDHARLAAHSTTPICLDESITNALTAAHAIELGACNAVSIKAGRLGGLTAARAVHDVCVHRDVDALAGGMLETGIGRAALLALAALPGCTLTGDCAASDRYFGPGGDLTEPFVLHDGRLAVPDGAGIGVEPIPDRLARCTIAHERVTGH